MSLFFCVKEVDTREGRTQLKLEPGVQPAELQYAREKTHTHNITHKHTSETESGKREKKRTYLKYGSIDRADKKPEAKMKGPSCQLIY
jgi:hypothetical protein